MGWPPQNIYLSHEVSLIVTVVIKSNLFILIYTRGRTKLAFQSIFILFACILRVVSSVFLFVVFSIENNHHFIIQKEKECAPVYFWFARTPSMRHWYRLINPTTVEMGGREKKINIPSPTRIYFVYNETEWPFHTNPFTFFLSFLRPTVSF